MSNENITAVKTTATLNVLAGIWLFVSPWVYGSYSSANAWNSWIVGALIAMFAMMRVSNPSNARGMSVMNLLLGIWTFASPWIYGYTDNGGRVANSLIVGALVFIFAAVGSSIGRTTTLPPSVHS